MYGQLLQRMDDERDAEYAVVGPTRSVGTMRRVRPDVRRLLRIRVFEVTAEGAVIEHED
jgi:hypothetical protein